MHILTSLCLAMWAVMAWGQLTSLIEDGNVEQRPVDLTLTETSNFDNTVAHSGQRSVRVSVGARPGERTSGGGSWNVEGFEKGRTYTVSIWLKAERIVPNEGVPGYGYVAIYQYDQFGDYVSYFDFVQLTGTREWERHTYTFSIVEETVRLVIPFGLFQASGTLWVDDFTLVEGTEAADIGEVSNPGSLPGETRKLSIAILKDETLPVVGAGSDPDTLKEIIERIEGQPYEVTLLSAAELGDRSVLSPRRFDMVILPYGETFPAAAAGAFRRFLRGGGDLLTMGGYAFNNLIGAPEAEPSPLMPEECSWHYRIPITEAMGKQLIFEGHLRCRGVKGAGFAYLAVYQHKSDGSLVAWKDTIHLTGDQDWTASKYAFTVAEGADYLDLKVGLYRCTGTAAFDDISLRDEQGQELVSDPGFENVEQPDEVRDHAWYRTQAELASIVTITPRSGKHCAKVKLATGEPPLIMNTARGEPGDSLKVSPEQIGVFDPQFPLKRVQYAAAAPGQFIVPQDFVADSPIQGWSAVTVLGYDDGRRIPLVNCYDRYHRLRGSVASITYHYGGYYAGSTWVIIGATNFDFFPPGAPGGEKLLVSLIQALDIETFLHNLETNYACYRQGEPVELSVQVTNNGRRPQRVKVDFWIGPEDEEEGVWLKCEPVELEPGGTESFNTMWKPDRFTSSFYRVEAVLWVEPVTHAIAESSSSGWTRPREWDRMESGFCVWEEGIVKSGPDCVLKDNLFYLNGREHFLQGTDSFSFVFNSAHENPLVWKRDFATMRDQGMNLAENLQVNAEGQRPPYEWPEPLLRKIDALVQLAQQYGQVYMPGLLIGHNVVVEDEVLEKEAAWVQALVKRYKDVPGLIWYINGDFQLRLDDNIALAAQRGGEIPRTDVERLWNEFLQHKYGSDAKLTAAWGPGRVTGPLGKVPLEEYSSEEWDDMRAVDLAAFKVELMNRWINRHVRAIREVDPHHAITSEYYRAPCAGIDIVWAIGEQDCANIGYFDRPHDDILRFPASMRFADLRARGKSMSAGEFGCKTHPAWGDGKDYGYHITRTDEQQEELWAAITHSGWALGASKVHNWDWKDNVEWVFPWGMVYPGDWVKKDCLDVYRAFGLVFRQFERRYEASVLYVLTPDTHRLGGPVRRVFEATLSCFNTLQYLGVDMGTLNECALEEIPPTAQVIFYPIPYQIPEAVYGKLLEWVKAGGILYVSGDVSYDMQRKRTFTDRLNELCGVQFVQERYPNIKVDAEQGLRLEIDGEILTVNPTLVVQPSGAEVLLRASGLPVLLQHRLGKGRVFYSTWPLELDQGFAEGIAARNALIYRQVLSAAGFYVEEVKEASVVLPVRVPLADHAAYGEAYVNPTDKKAKAWVRGGELAITLAPNRTGLAVWGQGGELLAVEDGTVAHFACYALDGSDIRMSKQLCVLPLTEGEVRLETRTQWRHPIALVGEIRDGEWIEYEKVDLIQDGESISLEIDQDRCFSILLVTEPVQAAECAREIVRSLTTPWGR